MHYIGVYSSNTTTTLSNAPLGADIPCTLSVQNFLIINDFQL